MERAALFVLASKFEGLGNTLVEALAAGAPVIATDCVDGPSEILQNGKYGQLVPVADPNMMANAILRSLLAKQEQLSDEFFKQFELSSVIDTYIRVLDSVHVNIG